uniref:Uncharacterized protein n=1 Tax=Anguilla anguilla TaxID=7936 RepID=A0A0E9PLN2_ANGAN
MSLSAGLVYLSLYSFFLSLSLPLLPDHESETKSLQDKLSGMDRPQVDVKSLNCLKWFQKLQIKSMYRFKIQHNTVIFK